MKIFIPILSILLLFSLITLISQSLEIPWGKDVLYHSLQPEEVEYHSYDPYELRIQKNKIGMTSQYWIYIVKSNDPEGVSHRIRYPYDIDEDQISHLSTEWTPQGIYLANQDPHRPFQFFIPKTSFIGGR